VCDFPSWIIDKQGKAHWLVDHDIEQAIEDGKLSSWLDATGHSALEKVLGVKGKHKEGREGLPDGFASDIRSGKCNRMARVDPQQAIRNVLDLCPPGLRLWEDGVTTLDLRDATIPAGFTVPASVTTLYLSYATIPAGFTVPVSVTTLDLSCATIPAGFTVPASVTTLDLSCATIPAGFTVPASVTTLHLYGATIPAGFTVPSHCKVYN
jgi:hypothetical protein